MESSEVVFTVEGGYSLSGEVVVQGSKNACLPMIAAALLAPSGQTILRNVPVIRDVTVSVEIARRLGARVDFDTKELTLAIDASGVNSSVISGELSQLLRASGLFLPPVFARTGEAWLPAIGGCDIGTRNLDFHLRGFRNLGAVCSEDEYGGIHVEAKSLRGAYIYQDVPSHTGTENLIMAAAVSKGETTIDNAACEPEIVDFVQFLAKMGAHIQGAGSNQIRISGVKELKPTEHTIMPDRMDAGTFCLFVVGTKGHARVLGAAPEHLRILFEKLREIGAEVILDRDGSIVLTRRSKLSPASLITWPYPGLPTDLQPQLMALLSTAHGISKVTERIFDGRFAHVAELQKLGASISVQGDSAYVEGPAFLRGAEVMAVNLRAGAALILAGLLASGETLIHNGEQIERGHTDVAGRLSSLGARIHSSN